MPGGTCGLFPGLGADGERCSKRRAQEYAIRKIKLEREEQDEKWGFPQLNNYCQWMSILTEEVGELAKEMNELTFGRGDKEKMRAEAIQVAAVALSILVHDRIGAIEVAERRDWISVPVEGMELEGHRDPPGKKGPYGGPCPICGAPAVALNWDPESDTNTCRACGYTIQGGDEDGGKS